mgnify:CR=1 FL=1
MKSAKGWHKIFSIFLCFVLFVCMMCLPAAQGTNVQEKKKYMSVAYITSWNWQNNIDAEKLTHINYAFGMVDANGKVSIAQSENLNKLTALREKNPDLKVLLSMQQVSQGDFCKLAQTQEGRYNFAQTCKSIADSYGLDGIDVDWEYPGYNIQTGELTCSNCKSDFTELLKELRLALGEEKLLTIACGVTEYLQHYTDFAAINEYLDFFNVMAYDYQVGNISGHQSNLYPGTAGSQGWGICTDDGIKLLISKGIPAEKMNLGVPFYSRTNTGGEYRYDQIESFLRQGYEYGFDEAAQQSYLTYHGEFAVAYDDPRTIKCKTDYVKENGLGGIMFWEYGQDDSAHTLSNAVWDGLYSGEQPPEPEELSLEITVPKHIVRGQPINLSWNAVGGVGSITYHTYVLKDGKRIYQELESEKTDCSVVPNTEGEYIVLVYCTDAAGNTVGKSASVQVTGE